MRRSPHVLPGFALAMGCTLLYLSVIVLLPLGALVAKSASIGWAEFWAIVSGPRAVASYWVTVSAALAATLFNACFGLLLAWIIVRYRFPGRRVLDALMDLPFALPTAVAGIALTTLFARTGWLGQFLEPAGIKVAYAWPGIAVAMAFTSVPFVVRSVQPVLEDLDPQVEEAAHVLGATPLQGFLRVILPAVMPALVAGCSLAFARSLGEFGAIIFIAGNTPFLTEVTSLLIFVRLEEFDYPAAASIASVVLVASFLIMLATNLLQAWQGRHAGRG